MKAERMGNRGWVTGIRIVHTGYVRNIIEFSGNAGTGKVIEMLADPCFNEFVLFADPESVLDESGIDAVLCPAASCISVAPAAEAGKEADESYFNAVAERYGCYVEIVVENITDGDIEKSTQSVYVYDGEHGVARHVMHSAECGRNGVFWDEAVVTVISKGQGESVPSYRTEHRVSEQDEARCVPYYDVYIILDNIMEIENCDDLRDYAEGETIERIREEQD